METIHGNREGAPGAVWWFWSVAAAMVAGFLLRVFRLDLQFPWGDEWHAIIVGTNLGFFDILTSFFNAAHSIPEALYYRALMKVTGITEIGIYAPFVLVGTATIGVVPFLIRDLVGGRASAFLAWLIALAPVFLYYSRFARPYIVVAALAIVAVWNFERWVNTRLSRHLAGYGAAAAVAAYFHVTALPFVLTPIAALLFRDMVLKRARAAEAVRSATLAALAAGVPTAVLLGAPVWNGFGAVAGLTAQGAPTPRSVFDAFLVFVGSRELPIVIAITGAACAGVWAMIQDRNSRLFAAFLLACSAAQLATVLASRPVAVEGPHILARYAIPVGFALLVFAAAGFEFATRRLAGLPVAGIAALLLGIYFANTSSWILTRYNSQTNLYVLGYLIFGKPFERFPLDAVRHKVPAFYDRLARRPPGELTIVEAPFHIEDYFLVTYQLLHRQRVLMGVTERLCGPGTVLQERVFKAYQRTRIRNVVDISDPAALTANRVDYLVLHRSIHAETAAVEPGLADTDLTRCIDHYRNSVGPAVFDDGNMVAFAISERARRLRD